eukprot:scaffold2095_cov166-Amphora_coffeaeformis.AAC.2
MMRFSSASRCGGYVGGRCMTSVTNCFFSGLDCLSVSPPSVFALLFPLFHILLQQNHIKPVALSIKYRTMSSQTILKGLKRVWKSIPISSLNQGASLSIRSQVPVVSLDIVSQWRDDGLVEFQQKFSRNKTSMDQKDIFLSVSQLEDRVTSLGRPAACLAVDLQTNSPSQSSTTKDAHSVYHFPLAYESKPISEVILDDGTIHADGEAYVDPKDGMRRVEYHDGVAHITAEQDGTEDEAGIYLSVMVPEKININVKLEQGGNITVPQKIEGDVELFTSDGHIKVKKLRGHKVNLESLGKEALVHASDTLEAQQLSIKTSGRVRAKQLHGSSINVQVSHAQSSASSSEFDPLEQDDDASLIDVSSLYVSGQGGATLSVDSASPSRKAIRVKTNHGPVRVKTEGCSQSIQTDGNTNELYPLVELGGVNGNFELITHNTKTNDAMDWKSCLVHIDSLSPDTVSLLSADSGDISLTIDRKVESDVRLLSTSSRECLTEAGYMLAEEEDFEMAINVVRNIHPSHESSSATGVPDITIATKAFTERPGGSYHVSHMHYMDGWVEDNSKEPPSRFDRKVRGETAKGKINMDSAADQALHGFGDKESETDEEGGGGEFPRPLLAALGTGRIKVETVSWLGAIARRYGLDESGRDLGRQATRRGRPIQPAQPSE